MTCRIGNANIQWIYATYQWSGVLKLNKKTFHPAD